MIFNLFKFFCVSIVVPIVSSNVILKPKDTYLTNFNFNFHTFVQEHNLVHLTTIDDLTLYTTTFDNFYSYQNTISELFEIEYEQVYTFVKDDQYVFYYNSDENSFDMKSTSTEVPWHLDRISKHSLPLDGVFPYGTSGSCHNNSGVEIHTYVVDTGIDVSHPEFEGRATFLENFTDDGEDSDGNSHGTHCAGIIGSKTYGVCKDAKLFAIKVLDSQGSGSTMGVIAGLDYAFKRHLEQHKQNPNVRSVLSMSLGGGYSKMMNMVVEKMVQTSETFYIVVAAGNEDSDACNTSPASAEGVLTVMASDKNDQRAYFSNYGKCADLYAPGVNVKSTVLNGKTAVYSGTSMATPNVAGVVNHYLDKFPNLNMKQLKEKMLKDATKNELSGNPSQTNNLLVYLNREN